VASRFHDENGFPSLQNAAPLRKLDGFILGLKPELGKAARSTVKLLFPIRRDPAPRSWSGLAQGMGSRWRESLAFHLALGLEVPKPPFTRFEALNDGMPGGVEMLARVLRRRAVATADVPAFRAAAKMKPPIAGGQTLHASGSTWRNGGVNARNVFFHVSLPGNA
jgi:hypothetical protein